MNNLEKQIENLIISNVPKSIDLMLPVNQDTELRTILMQVLAIVKDTNEKVKSTSVTMNKLLRETEQTRTENWFRAMF